MSTDKPSDENRDPSAVLDPGCVATIHHFDLVGRLYPAFITELTEMLAALRVAVAAVDRPTIRRLTHRFRGSAAQLGAGGLARALHAIEEAASDEGRAALDGVLVGLDDLVQVTIAALLREVERAPR